MKPRRLHRLTTLSMLGAAIFIIETSRKRCILAYIGNDGAKKRSADINRACARRAIWQIARRMAECLSPPLLTFVCSGPMSIKALSKIFVVVAIVVFAGWRAIGHPVYLDLYANDPRSKPELRAK